MGAIIKVKQVKGLQSTLDALVGIDKVSETFTTTATDGDTGILISQSARETDAIQVFVNGQKLQEGYSWKKGGSVITASSLEASTELVWSSSIVGFDLESTDEIQIEYETLTSGNTLQGNSGISGTVTGSLIPDTNEAYDLGRADKKFRDLYLSSNTIYMGGQPLSIANGVMTLNGNPVSGNPDTYTSTKQSDSELTEINNFLPTTSDNFKNLNNTRFYTNVGGMVTIYKIDAGAVVTEGTFDSTLFAQNLLGMSSDNNTIFSKKEYNSNDDTIGTETITSTYDGTTWNSNNIVFNETDFTVEPLISEKPAPIQFPQEPTFWGRTGSSNGYNWNDYSNYSNPTNEVRMATALFHEGTALNNNSQTWSKSSNVWSLNQVKFYLNSMNPSHGGYGYSQPGGYYQDWYTDPDGLNDGILGQCAVYLSDINSGKIIYGPYIYDIDGTSSSTSGFAKLPTRSEWDAQTLSTPITLEFNELDKFGREFPLDLLQASNNPSTVYDVLVSQYDIDEMKFRIPNGRHKRNYPNGTTNSGPMIDTGASNYPSIISTHIDATGQNISTTYQSADLVIYNKYYSLISGSWTEINTNKLFNLPGYIGIKMSDDHNRLMAVSNTNVIEVYHYDINNGWVLQQSLLTIAPASVEAFQFGHIFFSNDGNTLGYYDNANTTFNVFKYNGSTWSTASSILNVGIGEFNNTGTRVSAKSSSNPLMNGLYEFQSNTWVKVTYYQPFEALFCNNLENLIKPKLYITTNDWSLWEVPVAFNSIPIDNRTFDRNNTSSIDLWFPDNLAYTMLQSCYIYWDFNNWHKFRVVSYDINTGIITLSFLESANNWSSLGIHDTYSITLG